MKISSNFVISGSHEPLFRLYAFHYAGGSAAAFSTWHRVLPAEFQVCAAELPGRGTRFAEAVPTSLREFVSSIIDDIAAAPDQVPSVLFGHSLGALVALEVAQAWGQQPLAPLMHLFVSGCTPPQLRRQSDLSKRNDEELKDALRAYNGTPDEVLDDPEIMQVFLPIIRADLKIAETYVHIPSAPLSVPITVFVGESDPHIDKDRVDQWSAHTHLRCDVEWFDGDHFYLRPQMERLVGSIAQRVLQDATTNRP